MAGVSAFVDRIAVWLTLGSNVHFISVVVDSETLHSVPSTLTLTFDLSKEKPVPLMFSSFPWFEPRWVVWLTKGRTTKLNFSLLSNEVLKDKGMLLDLPGNKCSVTVYFPAYWSEG